MNTTQYNELGKLYYDKKEGLKSAYKLYKQAKENNIDVKIEDIKQFLKTQPAHQVTTIERNKYYIPIIGKPQTYQCDLMFLDDYKGFNNGVVGLFTFVHTISRKGFAFPIKDKKQGTINEIMKEFITNNDVEMLFTDKGSEFISKTFKKIMKDNEIQHIIAQTQDHNKMALIERFNKSLRTIINNYMVAYDTNKYIDVLDDLLYNYNNTMNDTTGYKPDDVKEDQEAEIVVKRYKKAYKNILKFQEHKVGDKVRIKEKKEIFEKGGPMWSRQIYTIDSIDGFTFRVRGSDGELLRKKYKHYEVKPVNEIEENITKFIPQEAPKQLRQAKQKKQVQRKLKKVDIDESNIQKEPRKRVQNTRLKDYVK